MKTFATFLLLVLPLFAVSQANTEIYIIKKNGANMYEVKYNTGTSQWNVYEQTRALCPNICGVGAILYASTDRPGCMNYVFSHCQYTPSGGEYPHYYGIYPGSGSPTYYCINNTGSGYMNIWASRTMCPNICGGNRVMGETSGMNQTMIYPNPTNGFIHFQNNAVNSILSISIYNTTGQKIKTIDNPDREQMLEIDLTKQSKGIYFVSIEISDGSTEYDKIILK